ncbi:Apolipoprotein(a), partial [Armadillidium nasatum]
KVGNVEGKFKFTKDNILMFSRMVSKLVSDLRREVKHDLQKDEKCHKKLFRTSKKGSALVVIYPDSSDEITLTSLLYEESEPWSACRRSCIASRVRNCRVKNLCEVDSLIEEAYCYVPGSKCEEKVKKIIKNQDSDIPNPAIDNVNENENYEDDYDNNGVEDYNNKNNVNKDEDMYFVDEEVKYYNSDGHDIYIDEKEESGAKTEEDEEGKGNSDFWDEFLNLILPFAEYDLEFNEGPFIVDPREYFYYDYDLEQDDREQGIESVHDWPKSSNKKISCGRSSISSKFKMFRIIGGTEAIKGSWPWQVAILNRFKVLKSFKHPDFNLDTIDSDIGLLKIADIKQKGKSKSLRSACLPTPFEPLPAKQTCFALGWGKERETHIFGSDILKYVKYPCDSGGPLLCQDENDRWVLQGVTSFGEGCGEKNRLGVYVKVSNYVQWINKIIDEN